MKLLITGANGQLGWELCQRKNQYDPDSFACDLPLFDLTDKEAVGKTVQTIKPDIIINAAAYTAVDQAEKEPDQAFAVNGEGPANLARICKEINIPLIHISTDYVFNGEKAFPYTEKDPVSPLGVYGQSKARGEENIRAILSNHIIIRTAWLYSTHGNNFVKTMLRLGKQNRELKVVDDQCGCPTCAADLAEAILTIADAVVCQKTDARGTYHYCNAGQTTWFQFAEKIFELAASYQTFSMKKIIPIATAEFPTLAPRPRNSAMDCGLIADTFNIKPIPWQKSLSRTIAQLYKT